MTITIKTHTGETIDFASLPEASQQRLVNGGLSHLLGNEVASIVTGRIRKAIAEASGVKADTIKRDAITAYREANESQCEAWLGEAQDAKVMALVNGTLGVRAAGVAVSPIERIMERLAKADLRVFLPKVNLAYPKKDETINLGGVEHDIDSLVDLWLNGKDTLGLFGEKGAENRARIERVAQRELKAKSEVAKRAAAVPTTDAADALLGAFGS